MSTTFDSRHPNRAATEATRGLGFRQSGESHFAAEPARLFQRRQSTPKKLSHRIRRGRIQCPLAMLAGGFRMPRAPMQVAQYRVPEV